MKHTGRWRSRLTGSMLGQLQLATYAAVLLGFTGATTTGLWLSERNQKRWERPNCGQYDALTRLVIERPGRCRHDAGSAQAPPSRRTHLWLSKPAAS